MKFKIRKMMALALAMVMVLAVSIPAMAATITINRDSTWDENAENAEATYTYYKIFDAKDIDQDVDVDTGEQTASSNKVAVYTLDSVDKVNALPTGMFKANNKATGSLTAADAASDGLFYITLADDSTSAADIATALKTMVDANTTLFPGTDVTSADNPVEITGLAEAYYLIKASNGSVLAVQTLDDVEINEKNDYPTVTKEQKKAADPDYTEAVIPAEIGKYIDYKITVHIPANANKEIVVVDKMTAGLEYDDTTGLTLDPNTAYVDVESTDAGYDAAATWQIKFEADTVIANQGEDIVITYRALVTEDALTDTGRDNEVTLTYDEGNYVLKDNTEYTTYFGGIYKVDPNSATADMSGVKFELTDGDDAAVNVTYVDAGGYYIVDPDSTSNEVETRVDDDGNYVIKIRGLDGDKTYKLTETETLAGYNLLEGDVTLTLSEDKDTDFEDAVVEDTFDRVENQKGSILPSTGGIGTTLFYVIGAILVLGAGILLVTRRRMNAN